MFRIRCSDGAEVDRDIAMAVGIHTIAATVDIGLVAGIDAHLAAIHVQCDIASDNARGVATAVETLGNQTVGEGHYASAYVGLVTTAIDAT